MLSKLICTLLIASVLPFTACTNSLTPAQEWQLANVAISTFVAAMPLIYPGWQYSQLTNDAAACGTAWTADTDAQRVTCLTGLATDLRNAPFCTGACPAYIAIAVAGIESVAIIIEKQNPTVVVALGTSNKAPKYTSVKAYAADWNRVAPESAKINNDGSWKHPQLHAAPTHN